MGPLNVYLFSDPDLVQEVFQDTETYSKSTRDHRRLVPVFGQGLLGSQGPLWRRQRRLIQPLFRRQFLDYYATIIHQEVIALAKTWEVCARDGREIETYRAMTGLTQRIIGKSMLSLDMTARTGEVTAALHQILEYVEENLYATVNLPLWLPTPRNRRFQAALKVLRQVSNEGLEHARTTLTKAPPEQLNLAQTLLLERDRLGPKNYPEALIRDEIQTMFLAGMETTSTCLTWCWVLLTEHPEVLKRLESEVDAVLQGGFATQEDLADLPYTHQVVVETLRLYPPIWCLSRQVEKNHLVQGFRIRRGYPVILSPYVTQRLPSLWEDPDCFRPERFRKGGPGDTANRHRFALFPFGGGPRKCIGSDFAMLEVCLVLASLVSRFRLEPLPGYSRKARPMVTMRPQDGLPVRLHRRP
jgi:cytochrome P450